MQHWRTLDRNGCLFDRNGSPCPPATPSDVILTVYAAFTLRRLSAPPRGTIADLDEGAFLAGVGVSDLLTQPNNPAALFAAAEAAVQRAAAWVTDDFRAGLLQRLHIAGSPWAEPILRAAGRPLDAEAAAEHDLHQLLSRLAEKPEISQRNLDDEPAVADDRVLERLQYALGDSGAHRLGQIAYAQLVNRAMQPGAPVAVLAEAETGTGKTLGYLAAAAARAAESDRPVRIATYTKALQTQAWREARRFYGSRAEFRRKVAVLKGRENYLCLLKYVDGTLGLELLPAAEQTIPLLLAWWMSLPESDGDVSEIMSRLRALRRDAPPSEFTDKRGECLHGACVYYKKCFIERASANAKRAELVIANHALLLYENGSAAGRGRIIFDEAHRLFDAADDAYSIVLGLEALSDVRRRLNGSDRRAMVNRIDELLKDIADAPAVRAAAALLAQAAQALPGENCVARLRSGLPQGPIERLFSVLHTAALPHNPGYGSSFECAVPLKDPSLLQSADEALVVLRALSNAGEALVAAIETAAEDETPAKAERLQSFLRLYDYLLRTVLPAYAHMLARIVDPALPAPVPEAVDFVQVDAIDNRLLDVTLRRHLLNPAAAFGERVLKRADGVVLTSAGLRDDSHSGSDASGTWTAAEFRTGVHVLTAPALRSAFPSPFHYAERVKLFVLSGARHAIRTDADYGRLMGSLFAASGGGGLGIFTAISRLRAAYPAAAKVLQPLGIDLYGQHVDAGDVTILADMFRNNIDSCLLGTDAVRDGLDVPGRALRLVVCDRVPYPRPTFLHQARRAAFGGRAYDRQIIRGKLKQAFGRLMRRETDGGAFVLLDDRCDDGLWSWLPAGVSVQRLPFEAIVGQIAADAQALAGLGRQKDEAPMAGVLR